MSFTHISVTTELTPTITYSTSDQPCTGCSLLVSSFIFQIKALTVWTFNLCLSAWRNQDWNISPTTNEPTSTLMTVLIFVFCSTIWHFCPCGTFWKFDFSGIGGCGKVSAMIAAFLHIGSCQLLSGSTVETWICVRSINCLFLQNCSKSPLLSGVSNDTTVFCVVCNDISDPSTPQGSPPFLQPISPKVFNARSLRVKVSAAAGLIQPASSASQQQTCTNGCHLCMFFYTLDKSDLCCCDVGRASPAVASPRSNVPLDDDGQQKGPAGGPISRMHAGRGRIRKRSHSRQAAVCTLCECTSALEFTI